MEKLKINRNKEGKCDAYAWPGGYPLFYLVDDGECLCPDCVDKERERIEESTGRDGWNVVAVDVNWEDPEMICAHCNKRIESAYAEDET